MFRLQITNSRTGELLPVENNPVTLALNSLDEYSSPGNTSVKGYNVSLNDFNATQAGVTVLFLEFTFTEEESLKIMGKVGGNPMDWNADFIVTASLGQFVVQKGFLDIQFELNQYVIKLDTTTTLQIGELVMYSKELIGSGDFLTVSAHYTCEYGLGKAYYECAQYK